MTEGSHELGRHRKPPARVPQRALISGLVGASALVVAPASSPPVVSAAPAVQRTFPSGLPAVASAPAPVVVPAVAPPRAVVPPVPTEVTVAPGDTLGKLAKVTGQSWQGLWARNLATVADPNVLRVGQVLSLVAPPHPLPAPAAPAPRPAAAPTGAATAAAGQALGVVGAAKEMLGVPYRWGGKSASGVDCSGLVYLALKSVGLTSTYRTSGALREWAVPISKSEARPGDLVFGPGHVGIYAGNGMMIDAPRPGQTVGLHKVYANMTSYGRVPT